MLQYLLDAREQRDIVVLYAVENRDDVAYRDLLAEARRILGIEIVFAIANDARPGEHSGYIDGSLVARAVPDFTERTFYVSGPPAMVNSVRTMLRRLGVHRRRIRTDFFPGLA
jgi:ferredoxin-NADP reductase